MSETPRLATLLTALACAGYALAAAPETLLPEDTYAMLKVGHLPRARAALVTHPLTVRLRETGYPAVIAPMVRRLVRDPVVRLRLERFAAVVAALDGHCTGAAALAVVPDGDRPPARVFLAETDADNARLENLIAGIGAGGSEAVGSVSREHRGVIVHAVRLGFGLPPAHWAVVDGTFVAGSAEAPLLAIVDAARANAAGAFAGRVREVASAPEFRGADALLVLNPPAIHAAVREALAMRYTAPDGTRRPGPFGMDVSAAYAALGLGEVRRFGLAVKLAPETTRVIMSVTRAKEIGLLSWLGGPVTVAPDLTVLPAGLMAVSAGRHDFGAEWRAAERLLKETIPSVAPMIDMQLNRLRDDAHLDVRAAVDNLTGEYWAANAAPAKAAPGQGLSTPSVFTFGVKDAAAANGFMESLAAALAPRDGDPAEDEPEAPAPAGWFTETPLAGVTVRVFRHPPGGLDRLAYVVHDGRLHLAVGADAPLARVLTAFARRDGGPAADPALKRALAAAPGAPCSVSRYDLGKYVRYLTRGAVAAHNAGLDPTEPALDPDRIPAADALPFTVIGTCHLAPDGLTIIHTLAPNLP